MKESRSPIGRCPGVCRRTTELSRRCRLAGESVMCRRSSFPRLASGFHYEQPLLLRESYCTTRRSLRPSTSMSAVWQHEHQTQRPSRAETRRCGSRVLFVQKQVVVFETFKNNLILARRVFRRKMCPGFGLAWRCRCKHHDTKSECSNRGRSCR